MTRESDMAKLTKEKKLGSPPGVGDLPLVVASPTLPKQP